MSRSGKTGSRRAHRHGPRREFGYTGSVMTGVPRLPLLLFAATASVPVVQVVSAGEIYRWYGKDGSTWFSEQPPSGDIASLEVLRFDGVVPPARPPVPTPPVPPYVKALEMADRLQADRLAREQVRLEREALQLKKRETRLRERQQLQGDADRTASYFIPYYGKHYRHFPHARAPYHRPGQQQDRMPPRYGRVHPPQREYPVQSPGRLTSRTQQAQRSADQRPGR